MLAITLLVSLLLPRYVALYSVQLGMTQAEVGAIAGKPNEECKFNGGTVIISDYPKYGIVVYFENGKVIQSRFDSRQSPTIIRPRLAGGGLGEGGGG